MAKKKIEKKTEPETQVEPEAPKGRKSNLVKLIKTIGEKKFVVMAEESRVPMLLKDKRFSKA